MYFMFLHLGLYGQSHYSEMVRTKLGQSLGDVWLFCVLLAHLKHTIVFRNQRTTVNELAEDVGALSC